MRRLLVGGTLAIAAILRLYSIASAHVTLVASEPAANSRLAASPSRLRLEFSEPVDPKVAKLSMLRPNGETIALSPAGDPRNAYALIAPVPTLGPGAFRVVWHVVSEDGHPVTGTFVFTVGAGAPAAAAVPTGETEASTTWGPTIAGAPAIPAVLRGLGVGAIAALAGLLFFAVSTGATPDSRPVRFAVRLGVIAILLLAAHLVVWLVNAAPDHRLTTAWMSSAMGTKMGRMELWRTLLAIPPLWALVLARRPGLALVLTLPPLMLSAAIGHSAAVHPMWSMPFKAIHLVALGAWVGGLLWLVMREHSDTRQFYDATTSVSTIALWSVIAIGVSGVVQSVILIPSIAGIRSAYGVLVLLKVAGLGALMAFGAHHRFRVMPRLAAGQDGPVVKGFSASLRREIALLWLVVVIGGLLAYVSPPAEGAAPQFNSSESEQ